MKVKELIAILKQFDPNKRVVIDAGGAVLMPADIGPLTKDNTVHNWCAKCDLGDIVINAYSENFKAVVK